MEVFMKVSAIIAAAGTGTRLGADMPKQFLELGGRPMLAWSIDAFCNSWLINDLVIVTHADYQKLASEIAVKYSCGKEITVVPGGATRQQSAFNGIKASSPRTSWVAVHDAARPFITTEHIENICMLAGEAGAAIPGIAIPDTVKSIDSDGFILETLDRTRLVLAQTPQVCRKQDILSAYKDAARLQRSFTDESSLLEFAGMRVALAKGTMHNFKITTSADLRVARMLSQAISSNGKGFAP